MATTSYCANTVMTAFTSAQAITVLPPPARSKKVPSVAPVYTRYRGALFTLTHEDCIGDEEVLVLYIRIVYNFLA